MGVGVELVRIECVEETASGRTARRRRRQRRWGSDELAVYVAIHGPWAENFLTDRAWVRTGVDSGESQAIGERIIAPSAPDPIVITTIGYELDGFGRSSRLAAQLFSELSRESRGNNFGTPGSGRPGWVDGEPMFLPPLSRQSQRHGLLFLNRFGLWNAQVPDDRAPYERGRSVITTVTPGHTALTRYVPGARTTAVRTTYVAPNHGSTYVVELELTPAT